MDLNAKGSTGKTGFMEACINNRYKIVELLLEESSIDFNAVDLKGQTAFILASCNGTLEIVDLIMKHSKKQNINLNSVEKEGKSAFILACQMDRKSVIDSMLAAGSEMINFDISDDSGKTGYEHYRLKQLHRKNKRSSRLLSWSLDYYERLQ